jgi:putative acetyltransferase
MRFRLRRAAPSDMDAVARLHRHVRKTCLPYLPNLHSPEEDLAFFSQKVFPRSTIWLGETELGETEDELAGFAAVRDDWLDHLYVAPPWHGLGLGSTLLDTAKNGRSRLDLWVFQRNEPARRFYERRGFRFVELTDGSGNEERMPDVRYRWTGD